MNYKNYLRAAVTTLTTVTIIWNASFCIQGWSEDTVDELKVPVAEPIPVTEVIETEETEEAMLKHMLAEKEIVDRIDDKREWYIAYKKLSEKYSDIRVADTIYDFYSESDIEMMLRAIETECYQADFLSKCNVANVILNRLVDMDFPGEPSAVVKEGFAYGRTNITEDTILALEYAFQIEDTTNGCLYFHSNPKTNKFCGASYVFTDAVGHHFYK